MVRSQIIESFVARIWLERAEGEEPKWRGHIQHIQGQEEAYFQGLAEVCEFLEQVSGVPGPELAATPERNVVVARRATHSNKKRTLDK